MDQSANPWLKLPRIAPYVLDGDRAALLSFNGSARPEHQFELDLLPEPFFGRVDAPVVLLGLNPGFDECDRDVHAKREFQALLRNNYCHAQASFPFYYLDQRFESPGRQWWEQRLKPLLRPFSAEHLAHSLLRVEYFPYHSRRFCHARLRVRSQEYGFELVRQAVRRKAVIVLMRGKRYWHATIPEIENYSRYFRLNSPQNVTISPGNCPDGFETVKEAIKTASVQS